MQKSAKIALVAVVVVVLAGAGGFYWFVLRSDNPAEVTLRDRSAESTTTGSGAKPAPTSADGTWKVQPDSKVFVGYRINELFAGETIKKEAVGRTGAVSGTMTIQGQQVTAIDITADMTQIKSDQTRRDNFMRNSGLQTDKFKTATFTSTAAIQLPSVPKQGEKVTVQATGDLTIHGASKRVTVPLEAVWTGANIDVSGKVDIAIADYSIERVSIPSVTVDTEGKLEIALSFVPQ